VPTLAVVTREIFWNVPTWARVLMYVSFVVAAGLCAYGLWRRARLWKRGKAAAERTPLREALGRFWRYAVLQVKLWRSPLAGLSHACIFWGFVVLFIGTCIVAVEDYGSAMLGREHFIFTGTFYLVVSCALDAFGVAFLFGLVLAILRRRADPRFRPLSRWVDSAIIWLFFVIGMTGFVIEGLRIAGADGGMEEHDFERWSFVGWSLAHVFSRLGEEAIAISHLSLWLAHMILSMAFVAMIPYCKLRHIFFAPIHVSLSEPRPSGQYRGISMEEVEATGKYGASEVGDFSRRQLLSFDACTECARCQSVCPAHTTEKPLSPMQVVLDIARASLLDEPLHGDRITPDVLWACTSCGACVAECPVNIDQLGAIVDLRRHLVGEGEIRGSAQTALRSVSASGNPWGMQQENRLEWAEGLDVPTLADEPEPEMLFWVGCAGSYDRRAQKVTRAMVKILRAAGVRFAVLGKKERCTGDPARRLGDEFTFLELAQANVETLNAAKVKRVVTTCPHCFNTIGREYPELGGSYDVVHHTQLIEELIAAGRLTLEGADDRKIAFHDPCYLARHNGVVDAPRRSIEAAGAIVTEPEQSGERGFCCGAGGGRMWMEEDIGTRVNEERFRQLEVLQPKAVAVGCPFCMTMLTDAAAAKNSDVEVEDVAEIVARRIA
jgi:Fe-S oxidoreductase/nitrate reductase gamma subunit